MFATFTEFDVKNLVIYEDGDESSPVLGIKEFQIAKALLQQESKLFEAVPSQWGFIDLFDLCLRFGYCDTAWALASDPMKCCVLEDHHLESLPSAQNTRSREPMENFFDAHTCLGFAWRNGVWMKDWNSPLADAAAAAKLAAKTPLVREILHHATNHGKLPFMMSDESAARLLDIAILIGNEQAAANLAKAFHARPLRVWSGFEVFPALPLESSDNSCTLSIMSAALLAGADFGNLGRYFFGEYIGFARAAPLFFNDEKWEKIQQCLPECRTYRWPTTESYLGGCFFSIDANTGHIQVSFSKVQRALRAGWDLKSMLTRIEVSEFLDNGSFFTAPVEFDASLLDLAVLCGQTECAAALARAGVELQVDFTAWYWPKVFDGSEAVTLACNFFMDADVQSVEDLTGCLFDIASRSDFWSAADAATRASLQTSFQQEGAQKGVAVHQLLSQKVSSGCFPEALVQDILNFSMQVPKICNDAMWDFPPSGQSSGLEEGHLEWEEDSQFDLFGYEEDWQEDWEEDWDSEWEAEWEEWHALDAEISYLRRYFPA